MSSRDDDRDDRLWQRMIFERQQRLERLLDSLSSREAHVEVSAEMKRELAAAISDLHRQLIKYDGEAVLGDAGIPDIGPIRDRLNQTTRVKTRSKQRGYEYTFETRPAVDALPLRDLETVARQIEAAANKLGHWASSPDTTEHDEFDHGDLAHLLAKRGQDEALEKVPGGDG